MKHTVVGMLDHALEKFADTNYVYDKTDAGWTGKTYKEVYESAKDFAGALQDLGLAGQVTIFSEGRSEWIIGEYGIVLSGGVSVPISIRLLPEELPFRINHSESKGIIISRLTYKKVLEAAEKFESPVVIIYCDDDEEILQEIGSHPSFEAGTTLFTFQDLLERGSKWRKSNEQKLNSIIDGISEDDTVTICYTSGTTGNPKGIMLTNKNYYTNCSDSVKLFNVGPDWSTLVFLPIDHSFAHTVAIYTSLLRGVKLYFVDSRGGAMSILRNIPANLKEVNPTFILTVPAITGNFMKKMVQGVQKKGNFVKKIFEKGLKAGVRFHGNGYNKPSFFTRLGAFFPYKLADVLIFSQFRKVFGNNFDFCVGGGALLDVKQQEFFNAIGAPVYQGYGLTEAAPVICSNTPEKHKFGSSGILFPSIKCRILDEDGNESPPGVRGEIVIQGGNVMKGYFKNPEASAEVLRDGWLYTGDLGYFDEDGFLVVVGRAKALLISDDGEKYSPEEIEEAMMNCSPLIHQAMLYCDHKNFTTALVVLDPESVGQMLKDKGITSADDALSLVKEAVDAFKTDPAYINRFPSQWQPAGFQLIEEEFSLENQFMNSTSKIVRYKIVDAFKDRLEYMYTEEGMGYLNDRNRDIIHKLFSEQITS